GLPGKPPPSLALRAGRSSYWVSRYRGIERVNRIAGRIVKVSRPPGRRNRNSPCILILLSGRHGIITGGSNVPAPRDGIMRPSLCTKLGVGLLTAALVASAAPAWAQGGGGSSGGGSSGGSRGGSSGGSGSGGLGGTSAQGN